jgi:AcrR family transcriptional regulator
MSAIATEAGVGKALLYSRFTSPGDILIAGFEEFITELEGEFPTIRDLLIAESTRMAELYFGRHSLALDRALLDSNAGIDPFPQIVEGLGARTVLPMRRRIRAAIESGELPPWTSVTQLLDIIEGAIRTHITAATRVLDRVREGMDAYIEQLVDEQLLLLSLVGERRGHSGGEWHPATVVAAPTR